MVQFGQTLNDVVKREWRSYAVPYAQLKQALRTDATVKGDNSIHTDSSYTISSTQKAKFGKIYDNSVIKLVEFYEDKAQWARSKSIDLEQEVTLCLETAEGMDISGLIDRVQIFSKDIGLILEFLELNTVAFSKIMKKFDKRTGSSLREAKIQEIKNRHRFLFEGGELKQCKVKTDDWIKQLYNLYTKLRSKKENGATSETSTEIQQKESIVGDESGKSVTWDEQILGGSARASSIQESKESKFIERCIEKVNEELFIQQAKSPFFDSLPSRSLPPSFQSTEIKLDKILGTGEYCRVHRVAQFEVPESCHICFLHRGFEDEKTPSAPSENSTLSSGTPSKRGLVVNVTGEIEDTKPNGSANSKKGFVVNVTEETTETTHNRSNNNSATKSKRTSKRVISSEAGSGHKRGVSWDNMSKVISHEASKTLTTAEHVNMDLPKKHDKVISFFSFQQDDNISDYDDLEEDHEDEYDHETRGFMKDHCLRGGEARYAIKRIKHELEGEDIVDAAIDLARESKFLAGLSHPSIIKIRGTAGVAGHPRFAIILDRLQETLDNKIPIWKEEVKQYQGSLPLFGFKKDKKALKRNWIDRMLCAYDIAHAMNYLHGRGILHRDLKPANIGFDVRGDVKIFDLGLAKELKPSQQVGHDQYHTSGIAGTRRYMAPEVAQVIPYGLSADVYSYGIVLWEMLTLKPAYANYTRAKHFKEVIVEGKRPRLPRTWPYVEKNLLERCWAPKPADRPTFQAVCQLIKFGLPDESFDSSRSVDLANRSLRSTGRHINSIEIRKKLISDDDLVDDLPACCS